MKDRSPCDMIRTRATKYAIAYGRMRVAETTDASAMTLADLDRELYEARSLFLQAVAVVEHTAEVEGDEDELERARRLAG